MDSRFESSSSSSSSGLMLGPTASWAQQPEVLAEGNLCGVTLLQLVSTGSAVIAELLRLSGPCIPPVFLSEECFDFRYFKDPEALERSKKDDDGDFLEAQEKYVKRVFALFSSIVKYWRDVDCLLERLATGYFIQHTVENVLEDADGKQLISEAFFLYGCMLLLMESKMPGPVRERIVVACYRSVSVLEDLEDVIRLVKSTPGLGVKRKKPKKGYPESFFARFGTPRTQSTARKILARLMADDLYLQSAAFPAPEHRSIRLAAQASMVYVLLYFDAETLSKESAMREIAEKHFSDNFIVAVYMGHLVDLRQEWRGYPAAMAALENGVLRRKDLEATNAREVKWCLESLKDLLTEGRLTEEFLMDRMGDIWDVARRCNASLRWFLLHREAEESVVSLLLFTGQLEFVLKEKMTGLISKKAKMWLKIKGEVVARMTELSEYFTGEKRLAKDVGRDVDLILWFLSLAAETEAMDYENQHSTLLGRKLETMINALSEVEQFEKVCTLQLKAFLAETRGLLRQMVKIITNVREANLTQLEAVADFAYAWELLGKAEYLAIFQARVRRDPSTAVLLRATLLKLASILDVPLIRISMCSSPDAASVGAYYSGELVNFARLILQVIPVSVFKVLDQIVEIQTHRLHPLPVKFEARDLQSHAQLDDRYELARLTHQIALLTRGILAMEKTLLGIIRVDPRKVLHEGLRRELVTQLSKAAHESLIFKIFPLTENNVLTEQKHFLGVLEQLGKKVEGYRRSVEYVQDYIDVAGVEMYEQEFGRLVKYNVEQESNRYLKRKIADEDSDFQSAVVPIPSYPQAAAGDDSYNFVGRTLSALLRLTSASKTTYAPERAAWTTNNGDIVVEVCGLAALEALERGLGPAGLAGLDRLLGLRVVHDLSRLLDEQPELEDCSSAKNAVKSVEALMPEVLARIRAIGHSQLLRLSLTTALRFRARIDAPSLHLALTNLDAAVLDETKPCFLGDLSRLLEASGMSDPLVKVYIIHAGPAKNLPTLLFLFVLSYVPKLQYDPHLGTLSKRKASYPIDGYVLVVGVFTVCNHFHPSYLRTFLARLGEHVCATVVEASEASASSKKKKSQQTPDLPFETLNTIWFVEALCKVAKLPSATAFIPSSILAMLPPTGDPSSK